MSTLSLWQTALCDLGVQIFAFRQSSPLTRGEVLDWAVVVLGRDLSTADYQLAGQTRHEVNFTRDTRGLGIWLVTILTFPLGLIAYFLGKRTSVITVRVEKGNDGDVDVSISGTGTRRVVEGVQYRIDHDLDVDE